MRARGAFLCLCLLLTAAGTRAGAQQQPIILGQSAVALTGPWRFSPGDSPWIGSPSNGRFLWAQPGFDDSRWAQLDLTPAAKAVDVQFVGNEAFVPGWTRRGFPRLTRYAWYRLRLHVDSHGQPVWLDMPIDVDDGYQVYANGQYLGELGQFHPDHVTLYYSFPLTLRLPDPGPGGILDIALRFYMSDMTPLRWPDAGGMHAPPTLGIRSSILLVRGRDNAVILDTEACDTLGALLYLLALPVAIWAAFRNRRDRSWMWLALALACSAAAVVSSFALEPIRSGAPVPFWLGEICGSAVFGSAAVFCWILFWWRWFGLEQRRWIPQAAAVLAASYTLAYGLFQSPVLGFGFAGHATLRAALAAATTLIALRGILILILLFEAFRKDRAAALLATAPILLLEFAGFSVLLLAVFHFETQLRFGPFSIDYNVLALICMMLIVGVLSARRFLLNRDLEVIERESVARDLEQARQLQQGVLVPEHVRSPLWSVQVAYRPAQTVGGDFFQTIVQPDGTLLLVIGDVSGKGIGAAMLVAVLVGAGRAAARQTADPASILALLNEQLLGRSGGHFATCLVAALQSNGRLCLANAGHLPPWRNGCEIEMEGSLPLGMSASLEPAKLTVQLAPGDTLTFLSDGVVEAQSPSGELFGFERTRQISARGAEEIAAAAERFGQQDDITVLTVALRPVAVAPA